MFGENMKFKKLNNGVKIPEIGYGVYRIPENGKTKEWCMEVDKDGYINQVTIGGSDAWYMLGHVFWNSDFSHKFIEILENEYDKPKTAELLWESIFMNHLDELKMRIRKYDSDVIFEFDTLDELREFDSSYVDNTCSVILKDVAAYLNCKERDIINVKSYKNSNNASAGFTFDVADDQFEYSYETKKIRRVL